MNSAVIHRFLPARLLAALGVGVLLIAVVVAPTLADSPNRGHPKVGEAAHPSCHGLSIAFSNALAANAEDGGSVAALTDVAAKQGCDLSAVKPATHPEGSEDNAHEDAEDSDGSGGPPAEVVAAKCERIADKLAEAESRTHGNSAAAFSRQADKWSCED